MRKTYLLPLISFIAILIAPPSASAEEETLSPPVKVHDSEKFHESMDVTEEEGGDLNRELSAPEAVEGSEVRSFVRKDGSEVTEYSVKGRVYMVRVQPGNNLPAYYLYDRDGDGSLEEKLPGGYKTPSPPMWIIKSF